MFAVPLKSHLEPAVSAAGNKKRVLFVCTGNICRSPTAEGIARFWARKMGLDGLVEFDSAGTHGYHVGEAPDLRAQRAAAARGYDLAPLRARQVTRKDFADFDYVLAMDEGHLRQLQRMCPPEFRDKVTLFLSHAERFAPGDVPDPYYGGDKGFEEVLDMCEDAVHGLLDKLR
ncbi:low molecular weight protein-tyrosine-phosphatase [Uliginosibacterium sp. sgz301328]|uniref:low molecular weight protein-tyrosine-phosphatase n=1 Tax=Uliginosibacterium sp. sgz301328 TaxID=3243764 RepID=UPI00359CFD38